MTSLILFVPPSWANKASQYFALAGEGTSLSLEALDFEQLEQEDAQRRQISGTPERFAVGRPVSVTPFNSGVWRQLDGQTSEWLLAVDGNGAAHLNFGFSRFALPDSAQLTIYSGDHAMQLGPYTKADMLEHGQLWTPVLSGDRAVLVLQVATVDKPAVRLDLAQVAQGYRGFGAAAKVCKSGACNTDVACLAPNDPWNQPRRSVGAITRNGSDTCTGSLLNNTANDRRMLFSTATHCGLVSDAAVATVVVYWKYESPTCRQPTAGGQSPVVPRPTTTSAGLRFLALTNNPFAGSTPAGTRSDFTLIELSTPPPGNTFELYWAGWNRAAPSTACAAPAPNDPFQTAGRCASIHHPSVDEKRITFVETPMILDNIAGATGVHWRAEWDPTPAVLPGFPNQAATPPPSVTEPGSSGSPLYDANRRLVGVLSGGPSFCGATGTSLRDQYGGLFHAWDGVGTPTTRMRDLLDPMGLNPMTLDGLDSVSSSTFTIAAPAARVDACAGTAAPAVALSIGTTDGATAAVTLSATPAANTLSNIVFTPNPVTPSATGTATSVTAQVAPTAAAGNVDLPIMGTSTDGSVSGTVGYRIVAAAPAAVTLQSPTSNATEVPINATLSWTAAAAATSYVVELSRDAGFSALTASLSVTGTSTAVIPGLRRNTQYFWRVRAANVCGPSAAASGQFTTVVEDALFSDGFYE